jgi:hypothetical protein
MEPHDRLMHIASIKVGTLDPSTIYVAAHLSPDFDRPTLIYVLRAILPQYDFNSFIETGRDMNHDYVLTFAMTKRR